jgi:hypothetical protein
MRKVVICLMVVSLLACWVSMVQAYTLQIDAYIDGRSLLVMQGNTIQWHNEAYVVPGKHEGFNFPTKLTTTDMSLVEWYPDWPNGTSGNVFSDTFTGLNRPLASIGQTVSLLNYTYDVRDMEGGMEFGTPLYTMVYISQQPSSANNYTLIIAFDDAPYYGSYWYTATIDYTPGNAVVPITGNAVVPIPPTLLLLGSGLLGLAGWRRLKKG